LVKVAILEVLDQELYSMTAIGCLNLKRKALVFAEVEYFFDPT